MVTHFIEIAFGFYCDLLIQCNYYHAEFIKAVGMLCIGYTFHMLRLTSSLCLVPDLARTFGHCHQALQVILRYVPS